LVELQRRNKVGGIEDRRFGENDPTMAPETKMMERFAREKQRSHKRSSMFDLEGDAAEEGLTHLGRSLALDDNEDPHDDFDEPDLESGSDSDSSREGHRKSRLREMRRLQGMVGGTVTGGEGEDGEPPRKKSKKEVMEEVIAKSKLHKYERQIVREADDDIREKLDKEMQSLQPLLSRLPQEPREHEAAEDGPATIAGIERSQFERSFDVTVRKLAEDKRAKPTERTKTDEEKAEEESERLQELEKKRLRRMAGDAEDSEESENDGGEAAINGDEPGNFGLGKGIRTKPTAAELGFDDEDDFVI
jgi:nucleolar protein 14